MNSQQIMDLALEMARFSAVPYDSAIYIPGSDLRRVLFGIDIDVAELFLAKELRCDGVISHHPHDSMVNWYLPNAWKVFEGHIELMVDRGVPESQAVAAVSLKAQRLAVEMQGNNYDRVVSAARLLNIPFMNIHQPLDEIGRRIMQEKVDSVLTAKGKETTVQDLVNGLNEISELQRAKTKTTIHVGDPHSKVTGAVVAHGYLTNGGYHVAKAYFEYGTNTVIYIHTSQNDVQKLSAERAGNLIVTGHIASDSIGINPLVQALRDNGVEVITLNGII